MIVTTATSSSSSKSSLISKSMLGSSPCTHRHAARSYKSLGRSPESPQAVQSNSGSHFQRVHSCVVLGEVEGQVDAECVHLLVWIVRILHTHAAITFAHAPLHYLCLALAQIELVFLRLHRPPAHAWLLLPTQAFGVQLSKGSHVVRWHRQRNVVRVYLECGFPLLPRLLGDPHLQGGRFPCFLRSIFSDCC